MPILFILAIALVIGIVIANLYNGLIRKKNEVDNTFSAIDVMLKKRHDLLPNLITTVQAYMNFEKDVLTNITDLRTRASSTQLSDNEKMQLENKITKVVGNIMATAENYPDLKTNQNFLQLQQTWNELEEQIAVSRKAYNETVKIYNNGVMMFPSNIVANMMSYQTKVYLDTPPTERENINAKDYFKF